MRKVFRERNWLNAIKKDRNPSQTWTRIKIKTKNAFEDLSLLACQLPEDKQDQIFTNDTIGHLVKNILNPLSLHLYEEFDIRRTELAESLVEEGITRCIDQFKIIQPNEVLAKPLLNQLEACIGICKEISSETRRMSYDSRKKRV